MPYYHVYIDRDGDETEETDFSKEKLMQNIVKPFSYHKEFLCKGSIIDPYDVTTIRIVETNKPSPELLQDATRGAALGELFGRVSNFKLLEEKGRDVTREFIKIRTERRKKKVRKKTPVTIGKNVFIVHGRDHELMKELKAMLSKFGLNPIVLYEQPSGSRTIVEKLEKYTGDVGYAFVVITPEDFGGSVNDEEKIKEHLKMQDLERDILNFAIKRLYEAQLEGKITREERERIQRKYEDRMNRVDTTIMGFGSRARQNVILEFGYFIGRLGRDRVCCLYKGDVELPSDMHGIVYIPFEKSVNECRDKIVKELGAAGYEIKP